MKVKAKSGVRVPREDNPRRYVSDSDPLDVAETAYYLRRISDGDLIRVTEEKASAVVPSAARAAVAAQLPDDKTPVAAQSAAKTPAADPVTASVSKPQADTSQPTSGDNGAK